MPLISLFQTKIDYIYLRQSIAFFDEGKTTDIHFIASNRLHSDFFIMLIDRCTTTQWRKYVRTDNDQKCAANWLIFNSYCVRTAYASIEHISQL